MPPHATPTLLLAALLLAAASLPPARAARAGPGRSLRRLAQVGADGPVPVLKGVYDGVRVTTSDPRAQLTTGEVKELACGFPAEGGACALAGWQARGGGRGLGAGPGARAPGGVQAPRSLRPDTARPLRVRLAPRAAGLAPPLPPFPQPQNRHQTRSGSRPATGSTAFSTWSSTAPSAAGSRRWRSRAPTPPAGDRRRGRGV
jgi:hypothetical protein